jgi:hypothetical protein
MKHVPHSPKLPVRELELGLGLLESGAHLHNLPSFSAA